MMTRNTPDGVDTVAVTNDGLEVGDTRTGPAAKLCPEPRPWTSTQPLVRWLGPPRTTGAAWWGPAVGVSRFLGAPPGAVAPSTGVAGTTNPANPANPAMATSPSRRCCSKKVPTGVGAIVGLRTTPSIRRHPWVPGAAPAADRFRRSRPELRR